MKKLEDNKLKEKRLKGGYKLKIIKLYKLIKKLKICIKWSEDFRHWNCSNTQLKMTSTFLNCANFRNSISSHLSNTDFNLPSETSWLEGTNLIAFLPSSVDAYVFGDSIKEFSINFCSAFMKNSSKHFSEMNYSEIS